MGLGNLRRKSNREDAPVIWETREVHESRRVQRIFSPFKLSYWKTDENMGTSASVTAMDRIPSRSTVVST